VIDASKGARSTCAGRALLYSGMLILIALSAACGAEDRTDNTATARADVSRSAPQSDTRTEPLMTHQRILISSERGEVTAEFVDNEATRALVLMLPLTIEMRDHLRQEKTGNLPSPLREVQRQTNFSAGMLGLWGNNDFVIYYRNGRVPGPGIIVLGRITGDVTMFDHPGPVTVRIARAE
jgi:hypothetical protein